MVEVPRRRFGRAGEMASMVGLGGCHLVRPDLEESESVRTAIDRGLTFLDNCWDYNGGQSELRMGKALRDGYRLGVGRHGTNVTFVKWTAKKGAVVPLAHHVKGR